MGKFTIHVTREFEKDFSKLDRSLQEKIGKEISQLEDNPYVGKPLHYSFFREKKIGNRRLYYLIYDEFVVVFLVALSTKKDQQEVIDTIKRLLPFYYEEIRKKING